MTVESVMLQLDNHCSSFACPVAFAACPGLLGHQICTCLNCGCTYGRAHTDGEKTTCKVTCISLSSSVRRSHCHPLYRACLQPYLRSDVKLSGCAATNTDISQLISIYISPLTVSPMRCHDHLHPFHIIKEDSSVEHFK